MTMTHEGASTGIQYLSAQAEQANNEASRMDVPMHADMPASPQQEQGTDAAYAVAEARHGLQQRAAHFGGQAAAQGFGLRHPSTWARRREHGFLDVH